MACRPPRAPLITILGATGTGKSQLAVELATRFSGEIINGDAMQLYDGIPIITNKMPLPERKGIPHHLLGCVSIEAEPWRVDVFTKKALGVIEEIHARENLPILVGGTHYYTQSLLFEDSLVVSDPLAETEEPQELGRRTEVTREHPILEGPTEEMLRRLEEVDPVMAGKWHPNDRRKIQRSLEIFLTTGKKASEIYESQQRRHQAGRTSPAAGSGDGGSPFAGLRFPSVLFWVHSDHCILKARLDKRVDDMLTEGLLGEVQELHKFLRDQESKHIAVDKTRGIWAAIGYKEFENYITTSGTPGVSQEGPRSLKAQAIEQMKAATRQYAKRQSRWIRIKLVNALAETGNSERLFLLDSSDVNGWVKNVQEPATEVVETFLGGGRLPDPLGTSALARDILARHENDRRDPASDLWTKSTCDTCGVTAVLETEWVRHINSRRHRMTVRARSKNERNEAKIGEIRNHDDTAGLG